MGKAAQGTHMNDTAGEWVGRVISSIEPDYTVFLDAVDGKYRAECNNRQGTDYPSTDLTDASAIIQNALTAAGVTHGTVLLKGAGTTGFICTSGLTIPPYTTLLGAGISASSLKFSGAIDKAITLSAGSQCFHLNITDTGTCSKAFYFDDVNGVRLENISIDNFDYGLYMDYTWYCWINQLYTNGCNYGVYTVHNLPTEGNNFDLRDSWIMNSVTEGLHLENMNGSVLSNVEVQGVTSGGHGITIPQSQLGVQWFDRVVVDIAGSNGGNAVNMVLDDAAHWLNVVKFNNCTFSVEDDQAYALKVDGTAAPGQLIQLDFDNCVLHHKGLTAPFSGKPVYVKNCSGIKFHGGHVLQTGIVGNIGMSFEGVIHSRVEDVDFYRYGDVAPTRNWVETNSAAVNSDYNVFQDNIVHGTSLSPAIQYVGSHNLVKDNLGYKIENEGTETIPSGADHIEFAHGMDETPNVCTLGAEHEEVHDAVWSLTGVGNINITITLPHVTTADRYISWHAKYHHA